MSGCACVCMCVFILEFIADNSGWSIIKKITWIGCTRVVRIVSSTDHRGRKVRNWKQTGIYYIFILIIASTQTVFLQITLFVKSRFHCKCVLRWKNIYEYRRSVCVLLWCVCLVFIRLRAIFRLETVPLNRMKTFL